MNEILRDTTTFLGKSDKSILFLGNNVDGGEMWLTDDQVRTHTFVSGSTGSGKSELLISMAANAMAWGSGVTFIDGKSDMSLFAKVHAIATSLGREDDLYVLNFMQGEQGKDDAIRSHTINPLASMTSDEINQFVASFAEGSSADNGDMWRSRAIAMMGAIIPVMVWLRDERGEPFSFASLRNASTLPGVISLLDRAVGENFPERLIAGLRGYLNSLPGYKKDKGLDQSNTAIDQHGYLSMQFTRMFGLLADNYDHIFGSVTPDIDMSDVVRNRRILFVMLPSLDKSSNEISAIGRMLVSLIKSLMGQALRVPIEGQWEEVVKRTTASGKSPYLVIMDEVGHYMADGMGLMAAQARSLGIGLVFATQEVDTMFAKASSEASAILANTNTKIFMKAENPGGMHMGSVTRVMVEHDRHLKILDKEILQTKIGIHRFNLQDAEPWNARVNIDAILALSQRTLESLFDTPDPLEVRLQMLQPGQMLVAHGGRKTFGTAPFIRIEGRGHQIALSRFLETSSFVDHIQGVEDAKERMHSLKDRLSAAATLVRAVRVENAIIAPTCPAVALAVSVLDEVMKPTPTENSRKMFKFFDPA
jgi:hypothetical protein